MRYDLAIIGGGPAGYSAAFEAAGRGMKVVLFEKEFLGGTCLNRGCVPTKYLAHASELYAKAKELDDYGIQVSGVTVNPPVMNEKMNQIVSSLREGLRQQIFRQQIDLVDAYARIQEQHVILADHQQYEAEYILIASGSKPVQPFTNKAITSDEILRMCSVPKTIKIIGGGIIAVEMAHIYSSFGTEVTLCLRSRRILRKFDRDIANGCTQILKKRGVVILPDCSAERLQQIQKNSSGPVLSAIGRVPNFESEEALRLGIAYDYGIVVDDAGRTSVPSIFAAGDVIKDSPMLAHIAIEQGRRAVRAMNGEHLPEPGVVVQCIYVQPEIAAVGIAEAQAAEKGISVISGKQTMAANARTMISAKERGFIKITAKADTGEIVGAQLMCERASDIAAELALAVNCHLTVDDLLHSVRPHPSYCEAVWEAAAALKKKADKEWMYRGKMH